MGLFRKADPMRSPTSGRVNRSKTVSFTLMASAMKDLKVIHLPLP